MPGASIYASSASGGKSIAKVSHSHASSPSGLTHTADKIRSMRKLLVLLQLLPLFAHAGGDLFDLKSEDAKPWIEQDTALPLYPKTENLIPFEVSPVTRNRHYVDAASISVGKDEVVRYTVVIEASGGAKNISFEGLRCDSGERRIYAYGHPDRSWSEARSATWEKIKFSSALSYQKALYEDHFCPVGVQVKNGAEAVMNLRRLAR